MMEALKVTGFVSRCQTACALQFSDGSVCVVEDSSAVEPVEFPDEHLANENYDDRKAVSMGHYARADASVLENAHYVVGSYKLKAHASAKAMVCFLFPVSVEVEMPDGTVSKFHPRELLVLDMFCHETCRVGNSAFVAFEAPPIDRPASALAKDMFQLYFKTPREYTDWYMPMYPPRPEDDRDGHWRLGVALPRCSSVVESTCPNRTDINRRGRPPRRGVLGVPHSVSSQELADSKRLQCFASASLQLYERSEIQMRLFPLDIVAPSDALRASFTSPFPAGGISQAMSMFDAALIFATDEDITLGDVVRPRDESDLEDSVSDGPFLGTVVHAPKDDPSCIVVQWFEQSQTPLEEIREARGDRTGIVMELLLDTRLRIMWLDGETEDVFRREVSCLRRKDDDEEMDEPVVEDQDEHHEEARSAAHEQQHRGNSGPAIMSSVVSIVGRLASAVTSFGMNLLHVPSGSPNSSHSPTSEGASPQSGSSSIPSNSPQQTPPYSPTSDKENAPLPSPEPEAFEVCAMFTSHLLDDDSWEPANREMFLRRVQSEWRTLQSSLPLNVLSKVSEQAMQHVKFSIIGGAHTPYYQAFLCFDLMLPSDYPIHPPLLKFHSMGRRLNPNLYEDGHVCLSLLGTWEGFETCEKWNPAVSNILQVIVSIQGLIL